MPKCPMCVNGKTKITVVNQEKSDEIHYFDCFYCEATGEVDQEFIDEWERKKNLWCECGNPSTDAYYVPDNEHPDVSKHHWRCIDCRKIIQIG